jgi:hypothetical protein
MTLVRRSTSGARDAFGNDIPAEVSASVVGELQQRRRDEPNDAGELSAATWDLFLPAGTDVRTGDAVVVDGSVYEVMGDPWDARNPRTGAASHVEATVTRTATHGDEGGS